MRLAYQKLEFLHSLGPLRTIKVASLIGSEADKTVIYFKNPNDCFSAVRIISEWIERHVPFTAFLLLCLVLMPIALQIRGRSPAALFAVTALINAVFAIVAIVQTHALAVNLQGQNPMQLQSFYLLPHIRISVNLAFIMMVFAGITWLQSHFGALRFPATTRVLFWVFHLSILMSGTYLANVLSWRVNPSDHVDYLNLLEALSSITPIANYGATYSVMALVVLIFWSASQLLWAKLAR